MPRPKLYTVVLVESDGSQTNWSTGLTRDVAISQVQRINQALHVMTLDDSRPVEERAKADKAYAFAQYQKETDNAG